MKELMDIPQNYYSGEFSKENKKRETPGVVNFVNFFKNAFFIEHNQKIFK